jgi:hypothetical protein
MDLGEDYVKFVLALAPFVVCLAISLEGQGRPLRLWLLSATLFALSVLMEPFSVWAALPWLALIVSKALRDLLKFLREPHARTAELAILASTLYLPVGGFWAILSQLEIQPLGFTGIIVLLTGVHFHYAGFALPRLTGLWLKESNYGRVFELATWGVIMGVPLVAVGITTSQLGMPFWIEIVAVSLLAIAAFLISLGQIHWALRAPITALPRALFVLGGISLALGMILATIYGWRYLFPQAWATIPMMYAVHGTLNSLGFCLPGFVAWRLSGEVR